MATPSPEERTAVHGCGTAPANLTEAAATIALLRSGDRPWTHYANLIEAAGSALAVLRGDFDDGQESGPGKLFDAPTEPHTLPDLHPIEDELRVWAQEGMRFVTVLDPDYPPNLRTIHNRPPFLFARGRLDPVADANAVAVVGTRRATKEGLTTARRIAADLVAARYTVVSGLADGVDAAAHHGALEAGGRTVAVIGTGLRRSYPDANADLQRHIGEIGLVLSQFWPDAPPTKQSFPMRNVVMSGFSLATVVVEASSTSGAKMQATRALEHGRPVFLLARLLEHDWAREYAELPGTYVVRTASEILGHLERIYALDLAPA